MLTSPENRQSENDDHQLLDWLGNEYNIEDQASKQTNMFTRIQSWQLPITSGLGL
jgi:succinate dehydrogenase flavin-adding protein (antitoxin of CptAB toxin-antitoxin module)